MSVQASEISSQQQFLELIQESIENQEFDRLILSQYKGDEPELEKITCRVVELQQQVKLNVLYHYTTKDVTKNYSLDEALDCIESYLAACKQANLFSFRLDAQL